MNFYRTQRYACRLLRTIVSTILLDAKIASFPLRTGDIRTAGPLLAEEVTCEALSTVLIQLFAL